MGSPVLLSLLLLACAAPARLHPLDARESSTDAAPGVAGHRVAMAAAAAASTASWRRSLRQATDQQVVQQQQPGFAQKEGGSTFGAAGATAVAGAGQGVLLAQAGATQLPQAQVQGQAQQQQQQQQQAQAAGLPRCAPAASRELFASRAGTGGTVMVAVMNSAQWDFGLNWLHHVKAAGIDFYVVAAADQATSERLAAASEPCFEWFDDEAPKLGEGRAAARQGWQGAAG